MPISDNLRGALRPALQAPGESRPLVWLLFLSTVAIGVSETKSRRAMRLPVTTTSSTSAEGAVELVGA